MSSAPLTRGRRPGARISGALTILLVLAWAGCGRDTESRQDTAGASGPAPIRFTDVTSASGIDLVNVSGTPGDKLAIPESLGQGAAAIDYDRDGRLDLFVANGTTFDQPDASDAPRSALYRNLGGLRFEDVTASAGLSFHAWCHGATAVDFDADGHDDLYITVGRGPNRFFRNRGDGTFEDASDRWGGADAGPSTAAAFFDADADGDLDLYVGNYVHYDPSDPPNDGQPCEWRGLRVFCGPQGTTPATDTFFENRDGELVEATDAFGLGAPASYTLGAVTGDFDNDADVDLYVANDSKPNYLFENRGGRFQEVGAEYGVDSNLDGRHQAGMGVDFGDVDNDGRFELFVTNFSHDTNTLYHNFATPTGGTMFEDATYRLKLGMESHPYLSWGTRIVDLDLDGWTDIVIVSGHVYPQVDRAPVGTSYGQHNQVFRNVGRLDGLAVGFVHLDAGPADALAKEGVSRGLVAADLDDDGDSDLFIVDMDAPPTLARNDSATGHWIGFRLVGASRNRDAIGARVELRDSSGAVRWRERTSGGSYLSTGDPRLVFGLGEASRAVPEVLVRWPSGTTTSHADLAVDRYWVLDEREGSVSKPSTGPAKDGLIKASEPATGS